MTDQPTSEPPLYVVVNTSNEVKETQPVEYERAKEMLSQVRERLDYRVAPPFSLKLRRVEPENEVTDG